MAVSAAAALALPTAESRRCLGEAQANLLGVAVENQAPRPYDGGGAGCEAP